MKMSAAAPGPSCEFRLLFFASRKNMGFNAAETWGDQDTSALALRAGVFTTSQSKKKDEDGWSPGPRKRPTP
jgi:hypothetical protein